jgi:hypothetical protein
LSVGSSDSTSGLRRAARYAAARPRKALATDVATPQKHPPATATHIGTWAQRRGATFWWFLHEDCKEDDEDYEDDDDKTRTTKKTTTKTTIATTVSYDDDDDDDDKEEVCGHLVSRAIGIMCFVFSPYVWRPGMHGEREKIDFVGGIQLQCSSQQRKTLNHSSWTISKVCPNLNSTSAAWQRPKKKAT